MSIHSSAMIHRGAEIDPTADVGPNCIIDAHVRIGPNCRLMHNVFITGWTQVDEACTIHPGAIIGHEPQDVKYKGERSYCRIGRETIIREYVTIHRGTEPESGTKIGERCFLLAGCHVAHNCALGNGVTMINNVLLAGHVRIDDRVTMGGGAVVHQFVRIGELAMVGGNARVPMDVPPYAMIDEQGRVAGLNRIGLRRAGFTRDDTAAIRDAYRVLYRTGVGFQEGLRNFMERGCASVGVRKLATFLSEPSRRGIAGRSRRKSTVNEALSPDST